MRHHESRSINDLQGDMPYSWNELVWDMIITWSYFHLYIYIYVYILLIVLAVFGAVDYPLGSCMLVNVLEIKFEMIVDL